MQARDARRASRRSGCPRSSPPVAKSRPPRPLADVDMILHREIELARLAPAPLLAVVVRRGAHRHRLVRDVRHARRGSPAPRPAARRAAARIARAAPSASRPLRAAAPTSWPFAFAWPMSLAILLREACACSTAVWSCLRVLLEALEPADVEAAGPRVARRRATRFGILARAVWMSIICGFFSCVELSRGSSPRARGRWAGTTAVACMPRASSSRPRRRRLPRRARSGSPCRSRDPS